MRPGIASTITPTLEELFTGREAALPSSSLQADCWRLEKRAGQHLVSSMSQVGAAAVAGSPLPAHFDEEGKLRLLAAPTRAKLSALYSQIAEFLSNIEKLDKLSTRQLGEEHTQ
ncbi:hypothetical protein WJX84_000008 [Apatococcus fuscideae]|uniref:Uncharacterized protein n=1 Tax=Apatococcus fuscideae TaxID=2026836 RepID=A0AAW1T229_9CHLO